MSPRSDDQDDHERVSLAPLTPEEALRALLAVEPDDEPAERSDESERGTELTERNSR